MKASARRVWAVVGAALMLGAVNMAILGKERIRREGDLVYLRLEPVDPRSLMQGDYMALRFAIASELDREIDITAAASANVAGTAAVARNDAPWGRPLEGETRFAPITLDANRVASLDDNANAASGNRLRYRIRNGKVWLGTNAFFFEEGSARRFDGAAFGEFRVDPKSGEAVLVGLRDKALAPL